MTRIPTPFGKAIEISTQVFIDRLLPPLRADIDSDAVLQNAGLSINAKLVTKKGRLWGYSVKQPSELKAQWAVFRGLQTCIGKLAKSISGIEAWLEFKNNSQGEWALDERTEDSLPDAYLLPVQRPKRRRVDWVNIAIPCVYHRLRTEGSSQENVTKITRCMSQCMHRDARRRFVYGFTVEDSTMRLWYCNRAQIVASATFDFVTEWRTLFRFLLSVMFAERHHLGFDPSAELLDSESTAEARYEVKVRSTAGEEHVYRTLGVLSNTNAESILGRGTRVWKAVRIEDGMEVGDPVALKDSWVDGHREREGSIDASIRASATNDDKKIALDRSLLTVLIHGDVLVNGAPDRTKAPFAHDTSENKTPGNDDGGSTSIEHKYSYQVHYRIVYKEVCKPLRSVTSLFTVFKSLGEACHGLRALYDCGWVHRDVSVGNVLLFDNFSRIADLEYAERIDKLDGHQHGLVGTEDFIAVEVKSGCYMFRPQPATKLDKYPPGFDIGAMLRENVARFTRGESLLPPPGSSSGSVHAEPNIVEFSYNPLHDLESLWWIAVYFLINREVVAPDQDQSDEALQRSRAQRKVAQELFWDGSQRRTVMTDPIYFAHQLLCLHPSLQDLADSVERAREHLVANYLRTEENLADGFKLDHDIHGGLVACFYSIAAKLDGQDVLLRTLDKTSAHSIMAES